MGHLQGNIVLRLSSLGYTVASLFFGAKRKVIFYIGAAVLYPGVEIIESCVPLCISLDGGVLLSVTQEKTPLCARCAVAQVTLAHCPATTGGGSLVKVECIIPTISPLTFAHPCVSPLLLAPGTRGMPASGDAVTMSSTRPM